MLPVSPSWATGRLPPRRWGYTPRRQMKHNSVPIPGGGAGRGRYHLEREGSHRSVGTGKAGSLRVPPPHGAGVAPSSSPGKIRLFFFLLTKAGVVRPGFLPFKQTQGCESAVAKPRSLPQNRLRRWEGPGGFSSCRGTGSARRLHPGEGNQTAEQTPALWEGKSLSKHRAPLPTSPSRGFPLTSHPGEQAER